MAEIILETPRLILREMTQLDMPDLSAILQDEQTMHAYEGAFNDAETQEWLNRNFKRYQEDGVGLWAVILKDNGAMIGQAGITMQDVEGERVPEVGYLFNRSYWGNGYATEAAVACKEYGFAVLGYSEIFTIVRDTNIPSLNVAIRNGMLIRKRFVKHCRGVDMPHYVFSARKG
ncbi:MAG: GNAT family N-acetyltransferase [Saccharofermentanales bacterium]